MRELRRQSGSVSLFVVIFTALLITVITVSFVRIMIRDQQQAMATDLSQSAYDSAQAGVEDAKRALLRYQQACSSAGDMNCGILESIFDDQGCDTNFRAIGVGEVGAGETVIRQSENDESLDQAYTCVKITLNTDEYLGQLGAEDSKLVRLRGAGDFNIVELSWFSYNDFSSEALDRTIRLDNDPDYLPDVDAWAFNQPPVMRAQLMQTSNSGFTLDSFDNSDGLKSNAKTLSLYPASSGIEPSDLPGVEFMTDASRLGQVSSTGIECIPELVSEIYACTARLVLPEPINGAVNDRAAFLYLTAHYNQTHYKVSLYNGNTLVKFKAVQPLIDSTGRANDLFRRVESRVELQDTTFPYPEAALDLGGDLCKRFRVTDRVDDPSDPSDPPSGYENNCTY